MFNAISNNKLATGLIVGAGALAIAYASYDSVANAASTVFASAPSAQAAQPISAVKIINPIDAFHSFLLGASILISLPTLIKAICMR